MTFTSQDNFAATPEIILVLFACALLFAGRRWAVPLLLTGVAFTAVALWRQSFWLDSNQLDALIAFGGALQVSRFSLFFDALFLAATALVATMGRPAIRQDFPEWNSLLCLACCGMFLLTAGADLLTLFLGLELMSLSSYILAGFTRQDRRSNEGALKFLILGAFSSGLVAYGFSLLYALSGSLSLSQITAALSTRGSHDPLLILALATTIAGLLFKVGAVPFHMWTPDAYEGAPTPVTAFLAAASTAASVALLMQLLTGPLAGMRAAWEPLLAAVAVATLTLGNIAAIAQHSIKRLLAYSSLSHAGYLLLGLIAGNRTGLEGISVYLLTYLFMTVGAFAIVIAVPPGDHIADLNGLARRNPWNACLMFVFLLSLAGLPPTAGFLGKYFILQSLIETGHYTLAVLGTLFVIVSLYYYFRIVRAMFFTEPAATVATQSTPGLRIVLLVSAALTLGIGLLPEPFLKLAQASVAP